jgi:hypothetical protein
MLAQTVGRKSGASLKNLLAREKRRPVKTIDFGARKGGVPLQKTEYTQPRDCDL